MIGRVVGSLFSPACAAWGARQYAYARGERRMGPFISRLYFILAIGCFLLFRLEGPAWRRLWARYRPWFAHLLERDYQYGDPLRFVLQFLFLLLLNPWTKPRYRRDVAAAWPRWQHWWQVGLPAAMRHYWQRGMASRWGRVLQQVPANEERTALVAGLTRMGVGLLLIVSLWLMTQPFSIMGQLGFVLLLWIVALLLRRVPGRLSLLALILISLTVSGRYLWWRYTDTLNWQDDKDALFGGVLLVAETYSWIVLVLGYFQNIWPLHRQVAPLPTAISEWPTVDIMIPTYNEDLEVVKPTVYAALGIDWPADKRRVHLLDDGRRPEFKAFAAEVGINYITRPDGRHAKAGNLNHALQHTDGELIAVFDCDHVPVRSFLQLTVGWFLKNPRMALVQTPHHFFSPDPFERNLGNFGRQPNENTLFYGLIQEGNDFWNAAFFCGSCALLRRKALEEIGGFAVETVTEDAHTALRLHRQGYDSAYLSTPLAAGLATESLSAHIGQRIRWARGMVQIFRTDNPLFGKGLSLAQRLCYCNGMLHFLSGLPRLVYLTAPLAFLIAHAYIIYAPAVVILLYVLPHMFHAALTNSALQGSYRRTFWGEIYETVLSWYIALPTTLALLAPKKGLFNVTEKGGLIEQPYFDWRIARPYMLLALANAIGLGFGLWRLGTGPANEQLTVVVTMLWTLYNLMILGAALAVAAETRQRRRNHRVELSLPAVLLTETDKAYAATLVDYSSQGLSLQLKQPISLTEGEKLTVCLYRGQRSFYFPVRLIRYQAGRLGLALTELSRQQQIDYVQCTFARSDAWLDVLQKFGPDKPVASFMDILRISWSGYRKMGHFLPRPILRIARPIQYLGRELVSFIPRLGRRQADEKLLD